MERYSFNSLMIEDENDIERFYSSEKELLEPFLYSKYDKNKNNSDYLLNSENLDDILHLCFKEFVPKNNSPRSPTIMEIAIGLLKRKEKKSEEKTYKQESYDLTHVPISSKKLLSKIQQKWIEIRKTNEINLVLKSSGQRKGVRRIVKIPTARKFGLQYKLIKGKKIVVQPKKIEYVSPVIYLPVSVETIGYSQER